MQLTLHSPEIKLSFTMFLPLITFLLILSLTISITLINLIHKLHTRLSTSNKKKKNPPGPPGLPFIGNLLQFDGSKPHIYLRQLSEKYGPLAYLKHGSTPILVVSSAKMAGEILKTHDEAFCSRPPATGQQKLAYGGVDIAFSPCNRHWREMRKICAVHLLSPARVLSFRAIREEEVGRVVARIADGSPGGVADLSRMAMSLACNLVCRVAFGRRYDEDEYEKIRFDRLIMEAQALMVSFYFSDHFPALGWMDKLTGLHDRLDRNCKELDVFYQQLIDEHLDPSRPKPDRQDIIDLMIQLKDQNSSSSLDLITWDHIKALLMDLFVAGSDTVAASIVWAMTALMLNPTIMKKTQSHIREAIAKKGKIDENDIAKLPYLRAVVLETLRLYPPAPLLYRTQILHDDCTIEGYSIKPGTSIFINGWAIAKDPETWMNPDEFQPDRFIIGRNCELIDHVGKLGREFEMIPFGGGRRRCPGMGMGLISVELALANLLYSFDWTLPEDARGHIDTDALPGLTMHKKRALVLVATKV